MNEAVRMFCRMVTFVDDEIKRSLSIGFTPPEDYGEDVARRFGERMGIDGVVFLVQPHFDGLSTEERRAAGEELRMAQKEAGYNYVMQTLDNKWKFSIGSPMLDVSVSTNGEISWSQPTDEEIFR